MGVSGWSMSLRRGIDESCIDDGSLPEHQILDLGLIVDDVEDLLAQIMFFKQVTEVEDRSFVGYRIIAGQTDEFAKGKRIAESIFHAGIAEISGPPTFVKQWVTD